MPADVTGYELLGREPGLQGPEMVFRPGPVFANLVLADEINRAAPKTQSALLEAMAEPRDRRVARPTLGRAVPGGGHAEPDRAGGYLSASRGPTGPLHDGDPHRLSVTPEQGRGDRDEDDCRRAAAMPEAVVGSAEFLELRDLVLAVPAAAERGLVCRGIVRREPSRRPAGQPLQSARLRVLGRGAARRRRIWCWRPRPVRCCWVERHATDRGRCPRAVAAADPAPPRS